MNLKKFYLMIFLIIFTANCADKSIYIPSAISENKEANIIKIFIKIEGLESAYYQTIINSIRSIKSYTSHRITLSKDGYFEGSFRFIENQDNEQEIISKLNAIFLVMGRTADITNTPGILKIRITD